MGMENIIIQIWLYLNCLRLFAAGCYPLQTLFPSRRPSDKFWINPLQGIGLVRASSIFKPIIFTHLGMQQILHPTYHKAISPTSIKDWSIWNKSNDSPVWDLSFLAVQIFIRDSAAGRHGILGSALFWHGT